MNGKQAHISFEEMVDLGGDLVDDARKQGAESHLAGCGRCRAQYRRVRMIAEAMRVDATEEVPAHVLERTLDLFPGDVAPVVSPSLGERLAAVLRDSVSLGVPAFGIRSGRSDARRMTFEAGSFLIGIVVRSSENGSSVEGEIDGGWLGGEAMLVGSSDRYAAEIGDLGEFSFRGVRDGVYEMTLNRADSVITIPRVEIGFPGDE